jgi:fructosamine-3-kinase
VTWATITRSLLDDGTPVVEKRTTYDARLEAEGLDVLRAAGAPTPQVYTVSERELVMAEVSGKADWAALGRTIAQVHRTTGATFGWHRDNIIGPLRQYNPPTRSWPEFFVATRVVPLLDAVPVAAARRLDVACAGPLADLLDHDCKPSLVHGDLWSGNVVDGAWLIDPAVSYSDREIELAFSTLFGGIPQAFYRAYEEAWPLDDGWQDRRPALQLYHLLVHCHLFGGSYVEMVEDRLAYYGW